MNTDRFRSGHAAAICFLLIMALGVPAAAQERGLEAALDSTPSIGEEVLSVPPGTFIAVDLHIKDWKRVHKNSSVEGHLVLPVYTRQQATISAGTKVRLKIESVEKVSDESGTWKKIGREILRAFNPLERSTAPEYAVRLKQAEIIAPDGQNLPLKVEVLRAGNALMIQPKPRRGSEGVSTRESSSQSTKQTSVRMLLRLNEGIAWPTSKIFAAADRAYVDTVREGRARAFLLNRLRASESRENDRFQALLAEPVRLGGHLFEAGSLVDGTVVRSTRPRILSRSGALYLRIERLTSPEQQTLTVAGTLDAAESDAQTRFVLDEEGILRGQRPGVKNALVDLGIAYALGKGVDDIAEAPIRALGAGMSNSAVANAARYFGLGASAAFLVTRHGKDVDLPKYGEIGIDFGGRVEEGVAEKTSGRLEIAH